MTDAVGVDDGGWGWGSDNVDLYNNGHNDIVHTNGWRQGYDEDQTRLFRNDGGILTEVAEEKGILDTGQGRGLLTIDYDRDGDLDIFIVNHGDDGPVLYRNDVGHMNDWLQIETEGSISNRDVIGAVSWRREWRRASGLVCDFNP